MKHALLAALLTFLAQHSQAYTIDQLAKTNVTHLQLNISNLNMLLNFMRLSRDIANEEKTDGFEKFVLTDKNRLQLFVFQKSPVAELTRENCTKLANKKTESYKNDPGTFDGLLSSVAMYELDTKEVKTLLNGLYTRAVLVADINSELSIECYNTNQ